MQRYLLLAILSLSALSIRAQQPLVGSIQGTILDQNGAAFPGVTLTATNIDAVEPVNHRYSTSTDKYGIFNFVDLAPGHYSIAVKMPGYDDYDIPEVSVPEGGTFKIPDIRMSPQPHGK